MAGSSKGRALCHIGGRGEHMTYDGVWVGPPKRSDANNPGGNRRRAHRKKNRAKRAKAQQQRAASRTVSRDGRAGYWPGGAS